MYTEKKVATFRERFTTLFDESDKTITEMAKVLHVSYQTISAWKLGTRSPKAPTVIAIADYFGVRVEWLMGFDVERSKPVNNEERIPDTPMTPEARIISGKMDKLPKEQREQILNVLRAIHPKLFEEDSTDDA